MVENVREKLEDSEFNYKRQQRGKPTFDNVGVQEFIREVQEIINNDPSKSMHCKEDRCRWKDHKIGSAWGHLLPFIQDEEGTISVQGDAGKAT